MSKRELLTSRAELRILAERLITRQEDERKRVARELYDDLSQRLSALQIGSADLARLAPVTASVRAGHQAHQDYLAEVVEEIRRLAYDLYPTILTHLGLRAALQSLCAQFSRSKGIDVEFSAQREPASLPEDTALCLYRVTQKSLRNVADHSGARSVRVSLKVASEALHLSIEDHGKGFDVGPGWPRHGLGLLSMNERVGLVHGTFDVWSRVGHGTRIEARVPIAPWSR